MSIAAGILRGLLKQGLSDINQTNEFYNDIIQTAGLNLTNATNTVNLQYPEDIKKVKKSIIDIYQLLK